MPDERDYSTFDALFGRIMELYAEGDYAWARRLAMRGTEQFPQNAQFLRYVQACMSARLNDIDQAFEALGQALRAGFWLGEHYWQDSDLDPLRDLPQYEQLRAESEVLKRQAQVAARPELLTIYPGEVAEPFPLVVALHGNYSSVRWHRAHWEQIARYGWMVALPQSSQAAALDTEGALSFAWDDVARAEREIQTHYRALTRGYPIDAGKIVTGGFSRGAEMAIQQAVTGAIPARGFVAVCPGGPLTREPELWEPVIKQAEGRDLRGVLIMGDRDQFVTGTERLVELLREAGVKVELERHVDLAHDYPLHFAERLKDLLAFVMR